MYVFVHRLFMDINNRHMKAKLNTSFKWKNKIYLEKQINSRRIELTSWLMKKNGEAFQTEFKTLLLPVGYLLTCLYDITNKSIIFTWFIQRSSTFMTVLCAFYKYFVDFREQSIFFFNIWNLFSILRQQIDRKK